MFRLYDTRTGQVETIEPARRGLLRMYSCGPDVGRCAHAGDLRSYLLAEAGILVAPGSFYGPAGGRHVRVALTATDERISAAAARLARLT